MSLYILKVEEHGLTFEDAWTISLVHVAGGVTCPDRDKRSGAAPWQLACRVWLQPSLINSDQVCGHQEKKKKNSTLPTPERSLTAMLSYRIWWI